MPRDRLRDENNKIDDLDDLIDAREERRSAFADDTDGLEDVEIIEDIDVDEALTFPHPHQPREEGSEPEPVETVVNEETGFDYRDSAEEMLPSDYGEPYSDALTTEPEDEVEAAVDDEIERMSEIPANDLIYEGVEIETPEEGGPRDLGEE